MFVVQHPKPAYPVHFLILPKEQTANVLEMDEDTKFWQEVPKAIHALVETAISEGDGYRIITNGGAYQEIPLLHIHFISGDPF